MNSKISLFSILCLFSLISVHAQSPIDSLQGKTIVIPGRNPAEVLYTPMAIEKGSFKKKYLYNGNIIDKPLDVYRVRYEKKDYDKAAYIVEMKNGSDTVVMHLPLRFPSKFYKTSKPTVFNDPMYYTECKEAFTMVRSLHEISPYDLTIPFYFYEDLQRLEQNYVGKTLYNVHNGIKRHLLRIDKDGKGPYKMFFKDNESQEERIIYPCMVKSTNKYQHMLHEFMEDHILEDSLKIEAQNEPEYAYFFQIKNQLVDKKVHIKRRNYEHQYKEIHNLTKKATTKRLDSGYYIFKDVRLLGFYSRYRNLPIFDTYIVLQDTEGEKEEFAVPYTITQFKAEVMLAEEYKEYVRQRELREAQRERERIEREKKEEAEAHAKLVKRFGSRNAKYIEEGVIRLGFTKAMVEEAWGYPSDETSIINQLGRVDCWTYGYSSFVYFSNGKVVQIIN